MEIKKWFAKRWELFPLRREKPVTKRPLIANGTDSDRITHLEDQVALIEQDLVQHKEKSYYMWAGTCVAIVALLVNFIHDFFPALHL